MRPHLCERKLVCFKPELVSLLLLLTICVSTFAPQALAKRLRAPAGGRVAVVIDERLAALRDGPSLNAPLLRRLGRGRALSVLGQKAAPDGLVFYRVAVSSRTRGWVQSDALVLPAKSGEDARLLRLMQGSKGFDLIERGRIFLDLFPKSPLRPAALMLYGEAAEAEAAKLSQDAARRLDAREMTAGGAPLYSYFLNYNGLDRYSRQGIAFVFDGTRKRFYYNGESWREILRRYPRSPEAARARERLDQLSANSK